MPAPSTKRQAQGTIFAGVDVGGTNIKVGLVDGEGRVLGQTSVRTEPEQGPEAACERIGRAVGELAGEAGLAGGDIARLGLATPGPMDIPAGMLLTPGNLPGWWDFPIRDRVSHHTGLAVTFANDANAAAYGEFWRGAGEQHRSMILLTLGTGVGGGIIVGGHLIEGEHSCGSECGHIIIDPRDDARRDSLNKTGSLEAYCGAYAVVARTEEALAAGRESSLAARRDAEGEGGGEITPRLIAEEAEAGDALAREIVMETARYLAIGIVTLVHAIDPDSVVLGGGMTFGGAGSRLGEEFLEAIRTEARRRMFEATRDLVKIEFATLGGDAGFIGAAGLARREAMDNG